MAHIVSASRYVHLFLGYPHNPQPVFRDLDPSAHDWPKGAVFAVTVRRDELVYPDGWPFAGQESATEFVAEDGWPVGFPQDKRENYFPEKYGLADFYRGLFHTGTPLLWRTWSNEDWEAFRHSYQSRGCNIDTETKAEYAARLGAQAGVARALRPHLPGPPR